MAERVIGGSGFEADIEGTQNGCSGWGEQLLLDAGGKDRRAAKKLRVAGAGTGRTPCAHLTVPLPVLSAEQYQRSAAMCFDGDGSADHIHNGVFRADLVKVDGLGRAIVNFALSLGQKQESLEREGLGGGADGRAGDDLADFSEAAMDVEVLGFSVGALRLMRVRLVRMRVGVVGFSVVVRVRLFRVLGFEVERLVGAAVDEDIDLRGGEATTLDAMGFQLSVEAEGVSNGFELLQRDAGVYGCAEEHVATDSGETIQVGNTHYESDGRWPEVQV